MATHRDSRPSLSGSQVRARWEAFVRHIAPRQPVEPLDADLLAAWHHFAAGWDAREGVSRH